MCLIKAAQQPQNPLAGPIRFELQPQGEELWFLRPPTSTSPILEPRPKTSTFDTKLMNNRKIRIFTTIDPSVYLPNVLAKDQTRYFF